jgi:hypothetical protein
MWRLAAGLIAVPVFALLASCAHLDNGKGGDSDADGLRQREFPIVFESDAASRKEFQDMVTEKFGRGSIRCQDGKEGLRSDCTSLKEEGPVAKAYFLIGFQRPRQLLEFLKTIGELTTISSISLAATACPNTCQVQWLTCRVYSCRKLAPPCGGC